MKYQNTWEYHQDFQPKIITNKTLQYAIAQDTTLQGLDVCILAATTIGFLHFLIYIGFQSINNMLLHGFSILGIGIMFLIACALRIPSAIRLWGAESSYRKAQWMPGKFISINKSSVSTCWIEYEVENIKRRQPIPSTEYNRLKNQIFDDILVLKYTRCGLCPFFKTGYYAFDIKQAENQSSLPFPWTKENFTDDIKTKELL